jgi:hypothetical protein
VCAPQIAQPVVILSEAKDPSLHSGAEATLREMTACS